MRSKVDIVSDDIGRRITKARLHRSTQQVVPNRVAQAELFVQKRSVLVSNLLNADISQHAAHSDLLAYTPQDRNAMHIIHQLKILPQESLLMQQSPHEFLPAFVKRPPL